jgi:hypothetical protein
MSTDFTDEPAPVSSLPPFRFSLLAVFLVVTLVAIGLGYAFRTRYCHATSLFRVDLQESTLWDSDRQAFDAREFEILKKTQLSLIKSYFVLQAALRSPAVASLPIFAGKPDPVAWLAENIEADFPGDAEVLEIRLRGNRELDTDIKQVVDAVASAYEREVVFAARARRALMRDALAKSLANVAQELKEQMDTYYAMKKELGSDESADLVLRKQDIDTLTGIVREMKRRLEIIDINAETPQEMERIQKIQMAVITYE